MLNLYCLVTHRPIDADSPKSPEGSKTAHQATGPIKEKKFDSTSSDVVLFHGGCVV